MVAQPAPSSSRPVSSSFAAQGSEGISFLISAAKVLRRDLSGSPLVTCSSLNQSAVTWRMGWIPWLAGPGSDLRLKPEWGQPY